MDEIRKHLPWMVWYIVGGVALALVLAWVTQ